MLDHLFGSKTRVRLLRIFFNNPTEFYYIRELTRKLGSQINAVRRELENLEKIGLIKSVDGNDLPEDIHAEMEEVDGKSLARKKFYYLNQDFALYGELKSLLLKSQVETDADLAAKLEKMGNIRYAALTGLFIGQRDRSVDILIVGTVKKANLMRLVSKMEKDLDNEIMFTIISPQEFDYRRNVTDRFLYDVLENNKIVLIDKIGLNL